MSVFLNEIQPEPRLVIPRQWTSVYKLKIIWCYSSFRIFPLSPKTFLLILVKGVSWRTYQVPDNHSSQQRVWKTDHYYCPHFLQKVESFIWRRSDSMVDFQNCGAFENQTVREIFFKTVHHLVGWQKSENILGSSGAVWPVSYTHLTLPTNREV